jgi:hypothetical protein
MQRLLVATALTFALGGYASAEVTAPASPTAPSAARTTTAPASQPKSAVSKACSAQADAKGLHGKERKKFRSNCKHSKA